MPTEREGRRGCKRGGRTARREATEYAKILLVPSPPPPQTTTTRQWAARRFSRDIQSGSQTASIVSVESPSATMTKRGKLGRDDTTPDQGNPLSGQSPSSHKCRGRPPNSACSFLPPFRGRGRREDSEEREREEDHLVNVAVQLTLRGSERVVECETSAAGRNGGMAFVGKMHRFATLTTSLFVLSLVN